MSGLVEVLTAHSGWAEHGPDEDDAWELACFDCGHVLCYPMPDYMDDEDRDRLQHDHLAAAVLAWVGETLAWNDVRDAVLRETCKVKEPDAPHFTCAKAATAALTAVKTALGVTQ